MLTLVFLHFLSVSGKSFPMAIYVIPMWSCATELTHLVFKTPWQGKWSSTFQKHCVYSQFRRAHTKIHNILFLLIEYWNTTETKDDVTPREKHLFASVCHLFSCCFRERVETLWISFDFLSKYSSTHTHTKKNQLWRILFISRFTVPLHFPFVQILD